MKLLFLVCTFFTAFHGYTQVAASNSVDSVRQELKKLWVEAQDAALKKDRKALERIYGDEFIFIHSSGEANTKAEWISRILSIENYTAAPMPSFDELYVYRDVALLRVKGLNRGTTVYARKNGQWQVVQVQSTIMPPERKTVTVDSKILDQYVGKYEQAPGVFTMITKQNDTLMAQGMNRPKVVLLPLSEARFVVKDNVGEFTFFKDEKGLVTHFILTVNGREVKGTKVE
jgi:hypothetical protein